MEPAERPPSTSLVRLDRAALERVLARAAELQSLTATEPSGELTEEELLSIGREVGLSTDHIRQALAEERTRVVLVEEHGFVARHFGPAHATASRVVPGQPDEILGTLDRWLTREQTLTVRRRYPDRMTWEARGGLEGALRRMLGGPMILIMASEVGASVTPMDQGKTLVRLDATLTERRGEMVGWSAATAGALTIAGGTVAAVGLLFAPLALTLIGMTAGAMLIGGGAAAGVAISRRQRHVVERIQLALDQLLDRLEAGEKPTPSLLSVFSQAARR